MYIGFYKIQLVSGLPKRTTRKDSEQTFFWRTSKVVEEKECLLSLTWVMMTQGSFVEEQGKIKIIGYFILVDVKRNVRQNIVPKLKTDKHLWNVYQKQTYYKFIWIFFRQFRKKCENSFIEKKIFCNKSKIQVSSVW